MTSTPGPKKLLSKPVLNRIGTLAILIVVAACIWKVALNKQKPPPELHAPKTMFEQSSTEKRTTEPPPWEATSFVHPDFADKIAKWVAFDVRTAKGNRHIVAGFDGRDRLLICLETKNSWPFTELEQQFTAIYDNKQSSVTVEQYKPAPYERPPSASSATKKFGYLTGKTVYRYEKDKNNLYLVSVTHMTIHNKQDDQLQFDRDESHSLKEVLRTDKFGSDPIDLESNQTMLDAAFDLWSYFGSYN